MSYIFRVIPAACDLVVAVVSLTMAAKGLFAHKMLSFHEKAAGKAWGNIDEGLPAVVLTLTQLLGLGFLCIALLLFAAAAECLHHPHFFGRFAAPGIATVFSAGLVWCNFELHKQTSAPTPWKGALIGAGVLLAGVVVSAVDSFAR